MNAAAVEPFRYNKWANLTLIDACQALGDHQLDLQAPPCSRSVRELLVHIVGGQQTFILRTKGRQHEGELSRWPGFDLLRDIALRSSDELLAIANEVDETSEVDLPYMGKVYRYPVCFFLTHALEHGVEHRTEIKLILGHAGIETPDLDGWLYSTAAGYGREVPHPR